VVSRSRRIVRESHAHTACSALPASTATTPGRRTACVCVHVVRRGRVVWQRKMDSKGHRRKLLLVLWMKLANQGSLRSKPQCKHAKHCLTPALPPHTQPHTGPPPAGAAGAGQCLLCPSHLNEDEGPATFPPLPPPPPPPSPSTPCPRHSSTHHTHGLPPPPSRRPHDKHLSPASAHPPLRFLLLPPP